MPFPQPAKDHIAFKWPNEFTLAQIDTIRVAVAACRSAGLIEHWGNPHRATVTSTKVSLSNTVKVDYWAKVPDGSETTPLEQEVTLDGF